MFRGSPYYSKKPPCTPIDIPPFGNKRWETALVAPSSLRPKPLRCPGWMAEDQGILWTPSTRSPLSWLELVAIGSPGNENRPVIACHDSSLNQSQSVWHECEGFIMFHHRLGTGSHQNWKETHQSRNKVIIFEVAICIQWGFTQGAQDPYCFAPTLLPCELVPWNCCSLPSITYTV